MRRVSWLAGLTAAIAVVLTFAFGDGSMGTEDSVRPASVRAVPIAAFSAAATRGSLVVDQVAQGSGDHVDHVDDLPSAQACVLDAVVRHSSMTRLELHIVSSESRGGRTFDPCAPARAGPKL